MLNQYNTDALHVYDAGGLREIIRVQVDLAVQSFIESVWHRVFCM